MEKKIYIEKTPLQEIKEFSIRLIKVAIITFLITTIIRTNTINILNAIF